MGAQASTGFLPVCDHYCGVEVRMQKSLALQAQMSEELLAAHRSGKIHVAIVRASDFIGPRAGWHMPGAPFVLCAAPGQQDRMKAGATAAGLLVESSLSADPGCRGLCEYGTRTLRADDR